MKRLLFIESLHIYFKTINIFYIYNNNNISIIIVYLQI
jgi:hypothetical protein